MKKSLNMNQLTLKVQLDLVTRATDVAWEREYRFDSTRQWKFDACFPSRKIAVEVEGGIWKYGRHNRAIGYMADLEKYNSAAALGYRIFRFTWQQIGDGSAVQLLIQVLAARELQ
jgi:very-short-patch-repair endonuclease